MCILFETLKLLISLTVLITVGKKQIEQSNSQGEKYIYQTVMIDMIPSIFFLNEMSNVVKNCPIIKRFPKKILNR